MMDSQKLQELLSGAKLPWTGDRYDGTVKYHIINSEGEVVYRTDFNKECDVGFEDESGFTPDIFMSMINYLPELLAENTRLKERLRWVPVSERLPELDQDVLVMFSDGEIGCGQFRKRCNHNPYLDGADIRFYHHQKDRPYGLHPEYIAFWKYDTLPEVGE